MIGPVAGTSGLHPAVLCNYDLQATSPGDQLFFNSYEYLLVFLPVTAAVYLTLSGYGYDTVSKVWLVLASLVFYSWWGLHYLPLIIISILVNYAIGTTLGAAAASRRPFAACC